MLRSDPHSARGTGYFNLPFMPFGLAGAPASFCRLMSNVFKDYLSKVCLSFLDDIIVFARTPEELLERLRIILNRLREVGFKIKPFKCVLFKRDTEFLGQLVSVTGVDPVLDKLKAIRDCRLHIAYAMCEPLSALRATTVGSCVTLHQ